MEIPVRDWNENKEFKCLYCIKLAECVDKNHLDFKGCIEEGV